MWDYTSGTGGINVIWVLENPVVEIEHIIHRCVDRSRRGVVELYHPPRKEIDEVEILTGRINNRLNVVRNRFGKVARNLVQDPLRPSVPLEFLELESRPGGNEE